MLRIPTKRLLLAASVAVLATPFAAEAAPHRPHHVRRSAVSHPQQPAYAYGPSYEGAAVAAATARAYREPGLTRELAPDAKLTATGGPVGGIPGFDGN